jgi:hypothetical protein
LKILELLDPVPDLCTIRSKNTQTLCSRKLGAFAPKQSLQGVPFFICTIFTHPTG